MSKTKKTNAMRILDKNHILYDIKTYEYTEEDLSGIHAAAEVGMPPDKVFKTLVGRGNVTGPVVFCIPVHKELDLKKAAHVSANKNVHLIHVKELSDLTGYIRGGCSPIGMKKLFPTYIDETALSIDIFSISAGQRGLQILAAPKDIIKLIDACTADLTMSDIILTDGRVRS